VCMVPLIGLAFAGILSSSVRVPFQRQGLAILKVQSPPLQPFITTLAIPMPLPLLSIHLMACVLICHPAA
jgi:hypothetical protein